MANKSRRYPVNLSKYTLHPDVLHIYADGASSPDGSGGWGAVLHWNGHQRHLCGGGPGQTNNSMELTGILRGLQAVRNTRVRVRVVSDSKYALQSAFHWCHGWAKRDWITAKGTPVANRELIEQIMKQRQVIDHIAIKWVPGHAGVPLNELADRLAVRAKHYFREGAGEFLTEEEVVASGFLAEVEP